MFTFALDVLLSLCVCVDWTYSALVVMGATGVATVSATTAVGMGALFFGTAGASLAGYKMMRRTRGVEEFEFEQCEEKVGLSRLALVEQCRRGFILNIVKIR